MRLQQPVPKWHSDSAGADCLRFDIFVIHMQLFQGHFIHIGIDSIYSDVHVQLLSYTGEVAIVLPSLVSCTCYVYVHGNPGNQKVQTCINKSALCHPLSSE